MADDRPWGTLLLVVLLCLSRPSGQGGQAEYSLRFHAAVGSRVHTVSRSDIFMSVGETWSVDLTYPLTLLSGLGRYDGVPTTGGLETTVTARLDSVVFRNSDTLAYIAVMGRFVPRSGDGFASMSGNLASMLVWSSGWRAYASASTRAVVMLQTRSDQNDPSNTLKMRFDITSQTRVRT